MTPAGRTALGVVLLFAAASAAAQRTFPMARVLSGTLSFDAQATLGEFTGTTDSVTGQMTAAGELREVRGWVEAPVSSLKTGNGLRDKDLNKTMETETHPTMRFDLEGVSVQSEAADSAAVTLFGRFTIHGVTRELVVPAVLRYESDRIRLRSDFPMNVRDYNVTRLSRMLGAFKMNPNITVHVDLVFAPGAGASPGAAPAGTPARFE